MGQPANGFDFQEVCKVGETNPKCPGLVNNPGVVTHGPLVVQPPTFFVIEQATSTYADAQTACLQFNAEFGMIKNSSDHAAVRGIPYI